MGIWLLYLIISLFFMDISTLEDETTTVFLSINELYTYSDKACDRDDQGTRFCFSRGGGDFFVQITHTGSEDLPKFLASFALLSFLLG